MSKTLDAPPATSRWWPYQEALVYRLALPEKAALSLPPMPGLRCVYLTPTTIEQVFGDEPALKRRFMRFVRQGAMGVAVLHGRHWLAYAWMATPEGRQPYHLPGALHGRYWIYYCHTRPAYRGRGLIGLAVRRLLAEAACRETPEPVTVYCDVMPDNTASRKAFLRLGFKPAGRVGTWRLPKSSLVMGQWDETASHEALEASYPQSG
jgi:RimJ/RimL family protein N-acetyltransferase